ncbi:MAG: hypothetical protein IGBAC_1588 [Ignavibacteriae bacterium]|nr:MAG: hypothetical protein IGBAC_1588 [Ignavibacteriota bacterium]
MACVNPDGTLSESAKAILLVLKEAKTPEEISRIIDQPLFKVRSALRDLTTANMVQEIQGKFQITEEGLKVIS